LTFRIRVHKRFLHYIQRRFNRLRGKKPLISRNHDIAILRRIRKRTWPKWQQIRHIKQILSPSEYIIFKTSVIIFAISIVWGGAVLIGRSHADIPAVGGKHIEAVVGTPQRINPVFSSVNDVDRDIVRLVYSGLMKYDSEQRLVPDLGASYEISEDKKTYTFKLREDVTWHDGEPFTSNDIIFTIQTIQDPLVNSPLRVAFEGVNTEALDDYTVEFTLSEPFQPFLSTLTVGVLPEHVWFDIAPDRIGLAQRNLQPVGTGPFLFKKLAKDETGFIYSFELERFENFYDEIAYIQDFVFRFFVEYEGTDGAINALRDEKVTALSYVPFDLRDKVERKHILLRTLRLPQYTALFLNQKRLEALQDDDVRTALTKALDKDRIVKQSLSGEGQVIDGPLLPGSPGYTDQIEAESFSITEANELLDKDWKRLSAEEYREIRRTELLAEHKDSFIIDELVDESEESVTSTQQLELEKHVSTLLEEELTEAQTFYRKNDDEELLSITLVTSDTPEYKKASQLIAGYWQEIGVKTEVRFVPSRDISREILKPRKYDVLLYGLIVGENPDQYPFWHSTQIDFPGLNLSRYVNRKLDDILEKVRETSDEEELDKLYKKFQDTILEDKPAIFLYTPIYTYAVLDSIKGMEVEKIFAPSDRFADVTHWYIKTKKKWR